MPNVPEITVFEGERKFLDFPITFGQLWSVVGDRNTRVKNADVTTAYFWVKQVVGDAAAITGLDLDTGTSTEMEWITDPDVSGEEILRVKLGANTAGKVRDDNVYELRLKLTDGSYITVESGILHIKASHVDQA